MGKMLFTKDYEKFFVNDKDLHTKYGYIKIEDINKAKDGDTLLTNLNKEMIVLDPTFADLYSKIKRGAQIVSRKDVGIIITETGIGKDSVVLDAGAGSGALCCFLAHIAKKVITYEKREDFAQIVEKNIKFLNLKNITLKVKDIYDGIDETEFDVITLDLDKPWVVVPHAIKALKSGGFLVSYSPTVPQVMDFINALKTEKSLIHIKTVEILEREWEYIERKVRPMTRMMGHTGFITFVRRL